MSAVQVCSLLKSLSFGFQPGLSASYAKNGVLLAPVLLLGVVFSIQAETVLAQEDFEAWKRQTQTAFRTYLSEQDKAFVSFLEKQWQSVETQKPKPVDTQPKPRVLPKAPKPAQLPLDNKLTLPADLPKSVAIPGTPEVMKRPETPAQVSMPASSPSATGDMSISLLFYGHKLSYYYDQNLRQTTTGLHSAKAIAQYYQALAMTRYRRLVESLIRTQRANQLSDWSYVLLLHQVAGLIEPKSESRRTLLTWFLCLKSGYAARVAYDQQGIFLLLPSKQPLFGVTYFGLSTGIYYALDLAVEGHTQRSSGRSLVGLKLSSGRRVYTYEGDYPEAIKAIDFNRSTTVDWIAATPSSKFERRERSFNYGNEKIHLSYQYQSDWVSYLSTLPQMDLPYYFNAPLPTATATHLLDQLSAQVKGKAPVEAVNLLLRFVQKAFSYKTDAQQFRQENYLFPIETLHYPYSDCEDRAALFAWLVRELLELEVIILDYPGHVATAVALTEGPAFGRFVYQKRRFWVADPTYVNAQVGQSMPAFQHIPPKILTYEPLP